MAREFQVSQSQYSININGVPQNISESQMPSQNTLMQKAQLALKLYKLSTNQFEFYSVEEQMSELTEVLGRISDGPNVKVIDVNENRSCIGYWRQTVNMQSFILFDDQQRLMVDSFVLEPSEKLSR